MTENRRHTGGFVSYLRVSTDRQGASGLGLEAQREAVRSYLNGGDWHIIGEFVEVESGANDERPKLSEALARCRLHNATLVIAKLDRLSRDAHFLLEMVVGIMAVVAQAERKMISTRTRDALAAAKARGAKLGGLRPGQRLTPDMRAAGRAATAARSDARSKDLAPVIADIRAAGVTSLGGIAKELSARGIPTARGGSIWREVQVSRVLKRIA